MIYSVSVLECDEGVDRWMSSGKLVMLCSEGEDREASPLAKTTRPSEPD